MTALRPLRPIFVILLFISAPGLPAQNLIVNGDFDTDLSGWTVTGEASAATHDQLDSLGRPDSGSLLISNLVDEVFVRSNCFAVDDGLLYSIGGAIQGDSFGSAAHVEWFSDQACANLLLQGGGFSEPTGGAPEFSFHHTNLTPPVGAQSGRAVIYQNLLEGNSVAGRPSFNRFDRMFVRVGHTFPQFHVTIGADTSDGSTFQFSAIPEEGVSPYEPTYAWAFGDGEVSTEQNPVHTYSNPGTYSPTVGVTTGHETVQIGLIITVLGGVTDVPTIDGIGMAVLALLLVGAALFLLRR